MSIAVISAPIDKGPSVLSPESASVVRIKLPRGNWAIFGKVCVSNFDGCPQNAGARLYARDGAELLDQTGVRIPGGNSIAQCLSVIGTLAVPGDSESVHISCSTLHGEARDAQLIAVLIDNFERSDG